MLFAMDAVCCCKATTITSIAQAKLDILASGEGGRVGGLCATTLNTQ